jgi:hypothetical protein
LNRLVLPAWTWTLLAFTLAIIPQSLCLHERWVDESYSAIYSSLGEQAHLVHSTHSVRFERAYEQQYFSYEWNFKQWLKIPARLSEVHETHPPYYYLALSLWTSLTKNWFSELINAQRSLSVVLAVVALILMGAIGYHLGGIPLMALSTTLLGCSFHFILMAQTARMHMLTLVLTLELFYILLKWPRGLWVGLSLGFGLFNSFFFIHLIAPSLWLLWRIHRSIKEVAFALAGLITIFGPYYILYGHHQIWGIQFGHFLERGILNIPVFVQMTLLDLSPFAALFKAWLIAPLFGGCLVVILGIMSLKNNRDYALAFWLMPIISVYLVDFILGSTTSLWAEARAVNFLLIGTIMSIVLSWKNMQGRFRSVFSGFLCFLLLCNSEATLIHGQHYFIPHHLSVRDIGKITGLYARPPQVVMTGGRNSFYLTQKSFESFDSKSMQHMIHLKGPYSPTALAYLAEFLEQIEGRDLLWVEHFDSTFTPGEQLELHEFLESLGFRLLTILESRGPWGPYEELSWSWYRRY